MRSGKYLCQARARTKERTLKLFKFPANDLTTLAQNGYLEIVQHTSSRMVMARITIEGYELDPLSLSDGEGRVNTNEPLTVAEVAGVIEWHDLEVTQEGNDYFVAPLRVDRFVLQAILTAESSDDGSQGLLKDLIAESKADGKEIFRYLDELEGGGLITTAKEEGEIVDIRFTDAGREIAQRTAAQP